ASSVDLLTAVNLIESISASSTSVHVVNAQTVRAPSKGNTQQMNIVDLTTHAEGSFSSLMYIAQLMETLPLAATILEVDFSRPPVDPNAKNAAATWQLNVKLRFYTTATLST